MRRLPRVLALGGLILTAASATIAATPAEEYAVKAVVLFNFTKFVDWPREAFRDADSPLLLCVLGHDPFGGALEQAVAGEVVAGRRLAVRRVRNPDDAEGCQLVFVSQRESEEWLDWLPREGRPFRLTVGESDDFLRRGGLFRLRVREGRVRFEVSRAGLAGSRLRVSSKLLSLADMVESGPG